MYIITWNKYQKNSIHDHSKNGCIYNANLKLIMSKSINQNETKYIDNTIGYHKMINNTDKIIVSLHIYSPPNYKTNYFNQSH